MLEPPFVSSVLRAISVQKAIRSLFTVVLVLTALQALVCALIANQDTFARCEQLNSSCAREGTTVLQNQKHAVFVPTGFIVSQAVNRQLHVLKGPTVKMERQRVNHVQQTTAAQRGQGSQNCADNFDFN